MPNAGVILVTGGSRGIGAQVSRQAGHAGYRVAVGYERDLAAAQAIVRDIELPGGRAAVFQADVGKAEALDPLFDAVEAELGPVTALVNNAGITGAMGPFADLSLQTLRRTFDVNVIGAMACAQIAVRRWLAAGTPGCIVNVSSIAATLGAPGEYVHYAATKGAVDTFTVGLAKEVAPHGIRVNAVAPGTALTDIHASVGDPDRPQRVATRIPMQRPAQPREIAEAVLWLLSDKASYVTGSILRVGGGL